MANHLEESEPEGARSVALSIHCLAGDPAELGEDGSSVLLREEASEAADHRSELSIAFLGLQLRGHLCLSDDFSMILHASRFLTFTPSLHRPMLKISMQNRHSSPPHTHMSHVVEQSN